MQNEEKISQVLDEKRPTLSRADKDLLWGKIEQKTIKATPTLSPYVFIFNLKNHMAPIALALILMLSTTGVVAASESSRPGDALFLVDQTVEDIRLALASNDSKVRLEAEFAAERLIELGSILEEELSANKDSASASTTITTKGEVRVNDALAITLSYLGSTNLSTSTKDSLYTDLAAMLEGAPVKIDGNRLRSFDNESRIEVRNDNDDDQRIEIRDGENRLRIREKDGGLRIDIKGDWDDEDDDRDEDEDEDDKKSEDRDNSRDDDDRRIIDPLFDLNLNANLFEDDYRNHDRDEDEDRDDEEDDDRDEDDDRNEDRDDSRDDDDRDIEDDRDDEESDDRDDSDERLKIEVRVEDGMAEVRLEQASSQTEFTLPYTTKAGLIIAIALKTGLTESAVSGALDLEVKD